MDEACENLAIEGLRTLVISQKLLSQEYFDSWNKKYKQAKASLANREEMLKDAILDLEHEMELLGITGVEGKFELFLLISFRQTSKRGRRHNRVPPSWWNLSVDAYGRQS